ncbi:MAG: L-seryl-tRNA(Sec) selenium transferase [Planctomycetes bacterium]|nr:L-seryl-tRNA(Sec) selenium transferase [Planctomycetota bacterium]
MDLRSLPAVNEVLGSPGAAALLEAHGREPLLGAVRAVLDGLRARLRAGEAPPDGEGTPAGILAAAASSLLAADRPGLCRVLNATGVVLHTGLGRAVLPKAAMDALAEEARAYCLLAVERDSAERGRRERFCEGILRELTGCEAATIVNNNAGATMLVLNTMAEGREAVVSRGQLVEIGGAFRMPDVMAKAGVKLVEVGCTNRTHLSDYRAAANERTAALVRVHPSNYRISGFSGTPGIAELCGLGKELGIPVFDDLGAGALLDLRDLGIPEEEPRVADSIAAGAALLSCSADKLIGGPQGGIILGTRDWVRRCEDNPLMRSLRVGKLDLIALEATLRLFRDRERLLREHPTMRMLAEKEESLARRAAALARRLRASLGKAAAVSTAPDTSTVGSGAVPVHPLPTRVVVVRPAALEAGEAARRLRLLPLPLFLRVKEGALLLDPRTLQPGEEGEAAAALAAVLAPRG